ncbi:MAG: sigma-70 family RNA polymerase sigma factor [Rikenellaceae bacterium]
MKSVDEILTEELQVGDRGAQRELYDRYSPTLMAIAMRYVGERSVAEDILHDSFVKIYGSIKRFSYRGDGSLKAWMSRIVVNSSLEYLRRNRQRTISIDTTPIGDTLPMDDLSSRVERVPYDVLLAFVAELPDGYRTVFNLFCIEEYSHREIAKELGINEKSSSSQLLRAKRLLAAKIKSYIELHE